MKISIFKFIQKVNKVNLNSKKKKRNPRRSLDFVSIALNMQRQPRYFASLHYDVSQILLLAKFKSIIAISLAPFSQFLLVKA